MNTQNLIRCFFWYFFRRIEMIQNKVDFHKSAWNYNFFDAKHQIFSTNKLFATISKDLKLKVKFPFPMYLTIHSVLQFYIISLISFFYFNFHKHICVLQRQNKTSTTKIYLITKEFFETKPTNSFMQNKRFLYINIIKTGFYTSYWNSL